jgi:hypothetical protein
MPALARAVVHFALVRLSYCAGLLMSRYGGRPAFTGTASLAAASRRVPPCAANLISLMCLYLLADVSEQVTGPVKSGRSQSESPSPHNPSMAWFASL